MKRSLLIAIALIFLGSFVYSQVGVQVININYEMCGQANGSATAFAYSGTTPYTYLWSTTPPQTTATATGLSAGFYTVTVTDNAASTASASVTINNIAGPSVSITGSTNATCGQSNGSATALASGGTGPYTYYWSTSPTQTTATASNIAAGTYTVSVNDNNGCQATNSVTITNSTASPSCDITNSVNETNGQSNGSATVTATGGTSPYTYVWSNSQSTQIATNLTAGIYAVTVSDANGCTCGDQVTITNISGIDENWNNEHFTVYPNPTDGLINIKLVNFTEKDFSVEIYDITGNKVYSEQIVCSSNKFEKSIDLNNLSKGLYYMKFISEEKISTRKITIQ
jgi:hypothetical protein